MRRIVLGLFSALFAIAAWATDTCSIVSIGASSGGGTGAFTFNMPATYAPGDVFLLFSASYGTSDTSTSDPSGFTLTKQGGSANLELWSENVTSTSMSAPSITWSNTGAKSGFIVAIRNTGGFPAVASLLGDSSTANNVSNARFSVPALTVTQGQGCAFQFAERDYDNGAGSVTGHDLTSGFVNAGTGITGGGGFSNTVMGQMFNGVSGNLSASNTLQSTGNTTASIGSYGIAVTLLSGDIAPASFTNADLTNQAASATVQGAPYTVAGLTNYGTLTVSGTNCKLQVNSGSFLTTPQYVTNDDTVTPQTVTSASSGGVITCTNTLGSAVDSWTATTDSTAPTFDSNPAQSAIASDHVIIVATATDSRGGNVAHYCSVYADGSAAPTAAQVKATTGTGVVASSGFTQTVSSASQASITSPSVLAAATAYDVYCEAEDDIPNQSTTHKVDITTSGAPASDATAPVILSDLFTGSNGTSLPAHTPTVDTVGGGWVIGDINATGAGTATIQSNRASVQNNTAVLSNVALTDMVVDTQWVTQTGQNDVGVYLRYIDKDNYNLCAFSEDGAAGSGHAYVGNLVAGVLNYIQSPSSITIADGNTYRLTGIALGTSIVCAIDGVSAVAMVTAANASGTKGGVGSRAALAGLFDNLFIKRTFPCNNASTGRVNDDPLGVFYGETLSAGCGYWAKTIPTHYVTWSLFQGGGWYYDPEIAYVGASTFDWERWDSTSNSIESDTWTYTTQGVVNAAPVWSGTPDQVWPISVPLTLDLTLYQSTRGVPPSTCTVQAGALVSGLILDGPNCIISGTPQVGAVTPTSVTIRATSTALTADDTFLQTITGDNVPDFPPFTAVTDAVPTDVTPCPNTVTLTGTNVPGALTVTGDTGAKYSKNGGAFTASAGTFVANDTVAAEVTAGAAGQTKIATVTAGGVSQTCSVTATPPGTANVNPFSFAPVTGVALLSDQSACTTVDGNTALAAVTVSGGTCTIDGGACPANLPIGGGTVCALHTASASYNTPTNTLITITGQVGSFTSTTLAQIPVCSAQVPTQNYAVGDAVHLDLSTICSGVVSYVGGTVPAGVLRAGAVFSGSPTTPGNSLTQMQASSANGSTNVMVAWNITAEACNRTVLTVIRNIFKTIFGQTGALSCTR